MANDDNGWGVSDQLAWRFRSFRENHPEVRQEDLVAAARAVGLKWSRSSVGEIEAGRRPFTAEELLLLPYVFGITLGLVPEADVAALLSVEEARRAGATKARRLRVGGIDADDRAVRGWLAGLTLAGEAGGSVHYPGGVGDVMKIAQQRASEGQAAGDAERKAARKLGLTPSEVVEKSRQLWGRTLTAERDRRVDERVERSAHAATIRATRGHVTRELLEELGG